MRPWIAVFCLMLLGCGSPFRDAGSQRARAAGRPASRTPASAGPLVSGECYRLLYQECYPKQGTKLIFSPQTDAAAPKRVAIEQYVATVTRPSPDSNPPGAPVKVDVISVYVRAYDDPGAKGPEQPPFEHQIAASQNMQHIWITYPARLKIRVAH